MTLRLPTKSELALLIASLVCSLIVLEVTTRVLFSDVTTTSDNHSWFARRWYASHPPIRNELGFRERSFTPYSAPGVTRIAVVGDSFTFGQGLLEPERMTDKLQAGLDARYPGQFEVLNFALPGADFPRLRALLATALEEAHPSRVLYAWVPNDFGNVVVEQRRTPVRLAWKLSPYLSAYSALFTLANEGWVQLQIALGMHEPLASYDRRIYGSGTPSGHEAERAFAAMIDHAREKGAEIEVLLWPWLGKIDSEVKPDPLVEFVLDRCSFLKVTCLDLRRPLAARHSEGELLLNRFDAHPSALANTIVADFVLARLAPRWHSGAAIAGAADASAQAAANHAETH